MPKVTLTEHDAEVKRLRHNLEVLQGGMSNAEMGKIIGRSDVTYAARLRDPETLTVRELRMICNYFRVDRAKFAVGVLEIT